MLSKKREINPIPNLTGLTPSVIFGSIYSIINYNKENRAPNQSVMQLQILQPTVDYLL